MTLRSGTWLLEKGFLVHDSINSKRSYLPKVAQCCLVHSEGEQSRTTTKVRYCPGQVWILAVAACFRVRSFRRRIDRGERSTDLYLIEATARDRAAQHKEETDAG